MSYLLGIVIALFGQLGVKPFGVAMTGCHYKGMWYAPISDIRPSIDLPPHGALILTQADEGYVLYVCEGIQAPK